MRPHVRMVKTRISVAPDGTLTSPATGLPAGEHEVEIVLVDSAESGSRLDANVLLACVRRIQEEVVRLPVLDDRSPDEIIGDSERGHFD
jgi:hypothetical protein